MCKSSYIRRVWRRCAFLNHAGLDLQNQGEIFPGELRDSVGTNASKNLCSNRCDQTAVLNHSPKHVHASDRRIVKSLGNQEPPDKFDTLVNLFGNFHASFRVREGAANMVKHAASLSETFFNEAASNKCNRVHRSWLDISRSRSYLRATYDLPIPLRQLNVTRPNMHC